MTAGMHRDATSMSSRMLCVHQQPEVNYLPCFGPQLISLEEYFPVEIDLLENLDIVYITLLVGTCAPVREREIERERDRDRESMCERKPLGWPPCHLLRGTS